MEAIGPAALRALGPLSLYPVWCTRFRAASLFLHWLGLLVAQRWIDFSQGDAIVACDLSTLSATAAGSTAGIELVMRPCVRILLRVTKALRNAVLVVEADVLLLHQHNYEEALRDGTAAGQLVGSGEAHWLPLVVPPRVREEHGAWEVDAPIAVQVVVSTVVPAGQVIAGGHSLLDTNVSGSLWKEQQVIVSRSQILRGDGVANGLAGAAITATLSALVLLGIAAQHHVTAHRHALPVYAHVEVLVVAAGSVHHLLPLTVVEPLALGHTVQLAGIGCICVRHPLVEDSIKLLPVEAGALLRPEVGFFLRTVLGVAGEVTATASTADCLATITVEW